MTWLYNLFAIIFILFYLPIYLVRGKFHRGFLMRLGFFPRDFSEGLKNPRRIWIHAVSVGEVNAVSHLIAQFRQGFPDVQIVLSTVTPTGNRLARTLAQGDELVIYLPLDLSFITHRFVEKINPLLFITTETELWPNLITSLKKKHTPLILVNGRISARSFRGYRWVKYFLGDILDAIRLFCMQSKTDAQRIISLGADKGRVRVTGNMKFDLGLVMDAQTNRESEEIIRLKSLLGKDYQLIVAGSTHKGEEEIVLRVYQELLLQFAHLRLLIAPRHIERLAQLEKAIQGLRLGVLRFSDLQKAQEMPDRCVLILDTIGQLRLLYNLATIVFVGGSLVKKGGHNIVEPAFFAKPIIVGRFMFNFPDITNAFLERQAVIQVNDELELSEEIKLLLLSSAKREAMGWRSQETIMQNRGATEATFNLIKQETGGLI